MKRSSPRASGGWLSHEIIPLLVAALGLVLTYILWSFVVEHEQHMDEVAFDQEAGSMIGAVERSITADMEFVYGIRSYYQGSSSVDRDGFRAYVEDPLKRYPNIQALEWIPRVSREQRAAYEAQAKADGLADFAIREKRDGRMEIAAERDEYFPVYYVEPLETNRGVLGFDFASNPDRLAALEQARDSGRAVATKRITLVQEQGSQNGFLLFVPVYARDAVTDSIESRRQNLSGFALGVYRVGDLVESAIDRERLQSSLIHLTLFDNSAEGADRLLYSHSSTDAQILNLEEAQKRRHLSHAFEVGGREWVLMAHSDAVGFDYATKPTPVMVVLFGLSLTLGAILYLKSARTRTQTIERLVEDQTFRLKQTEAYNQAIYDTVVDGIITINPRGVIQSCNPATGSLFGYAPEKLPGQKINMLMPEHFAKAHDGYLERYMQTGEAHVIGIGREVEGLRSDGSTFPLELAVSRMEVAGETFFTGVVRDVSERKRSEAYNKAIHDTVVDGIITIDPQGVIQSCNPATGTLFGYDVEKLPGQKINMLMPDHYARAHDGYLAQYMKTGEAHVIGIGREVEGRRSDGTTFPIELAVSRMEIGGETFFTGVVRDISERKQVDQMKAEFISTVSHELRTPLTSIRGAMGLVAGGAAGELPEQAKKLVSIAASNSERLVRLINDILDVEKIEAGKMQFNIKRQSLFQILERAIEENRSYGEEHGSGYRLQVLDDIPELDLDADRIRQVLDNLLSNAAKYGAEQDEIDVAVTVNERVVQISVQDHGPGIPAEFQERIFGKFAQADSSDTRQKGGTGLGLSIAKAIVVHHGGRIWFETEEGKGTRFIFQLPIPEPAEEAEITLNRGSRVLLCEDDPDVGRLLQLLLEKEGIVSDLAKDAEEALAMLGQNRYQAMTLDLMLPGLDGISLLGELRESEQFRDLPVVVVSAKPRKESDTLGAMQVSDWLTKPIEEQRLKQAVIRAIRSRGDGSAAEVLHVEDDPDIATVVSAMLKADARIELAKDLAEANSLLDGKHFDLVILDIGLPDGSGLDLLPRLSQFTPPVPVVIFSAQEVDTDTAGQVAGVLVKSRSDSGQLVKMVKELIELPAGRDEV
ncbi:MAG: CHASE domain-containing protein [Sedimenticola sp.]